MATLPKLPPSRKELLINKAVKLFEKIETKNKETQTLTPAQLRNLRDRVMKATTKELTGEIGYLNVIYKTL